MNALVTGGAGFIGSFIVERLLAQGQSVTILDNLDPQANPHGLRSDFLSATRLLITDIRDKKTVKEVLDDIDVVIHCAAVVGVAQSLYQPKHYIDVNVGGTATVLEALIERARPLHKLVVLTSMTGYGEGVYRRPSDGELLRVKIRAEGDIKRYGWEPVCPKTGEILLPVPTPESSELLARNVYALSKRYQEELALSLGQIYGFPVVSLRLFNVYGPRQSLSNPYTGVLAIFLSRLLAGQPPVVYEDGNQTRDFVSVHDVVNAITLALERPEADGEAINIGNGMPHRISECAYTLAHLLGRKDIKPQINHKFRTGDIRHCTADIAKAQQLLGYQPQVKWEDGLAELVDWARTAPSSDRFEQAEQELRQQGLIR